MRNDNSVFLPAFFLFCLLGNPGNATAVEDGASVAERFFSGSFVGSLLFGYPYSGAGTADMAAVAVLALIALRLAHTGRSPGNDEGRFTAGGNRESRGPLDRERDGKDKTDARDEGNISGAARETRRDNAWSRRMGGDTEGDGGTCVPELPRSGREASPPPATARARAEAMWGYLSSDPKQQTAGAPAGASAAPGVVPPDGFNTADFLQGARTLYIRLQKAWGSRDISDLAPFVTPEMLDTLSKQAEKNPKPVKTDILTIDAELRDLRSEGETQTARAAFTVLMRTDAETGPIEVAELWTFTRGPESQGMWRLCAVGGA
jgi:predicted lipid-binding transport protein (Tim44 family)